MTRTLLGLLALVFALATLSASAQGYRTLEPVAGTTAQTRAALVIGNATYERPGANLRNPENDAADITVALQRLGFTVTTGTNLSHRQMEAAVNAFAAQARGAEAAFVFYAGHGVEVDGVNYLVPTDADFRSDVDVRHGAISAEWMLEKAAEAAEDGLSVLVLDACRNNPFRNQRLGGRGLGEMQSPNALSLAWQKNSGGMTTPRGSLIAYATDPGEVASDGQGRNSPFTSALLAELGAEGVEFSAMLGRVSDRVWTATEGQQLPWTLRGYAGDFFLKPLEGNQLAPTFTLGKSAYHRGDYVAALPSLRYAAEFGDPEAQFYLGEMYEFGRGVGSSPAEAVRLYRLAADQGFADAQFKLATRYEFESPFYDIAQDYTEAMRLYRLAADQGHASAQVNLGIMYTLGRGVARDDSEAVRWFRLAADQGDLRARLSIGHMYETGRGVAQDEAAAARWYHGIAAVDDQWQEYIGQGMYIASAMYRLGTMHEQGRGATQDRAEAIRLYRLSATLGNEDAIRALRRLGAQ